MTDTTKTSTDDTDLTPFIDHPRAQKAAQALYQAVFAPINKAIDFLDTWYTTRLCKPYLPKE